MRVQKVCQEEKMPMSDNNLMLRFLRSALISIFGTIAFLASGQAAVVDVIGRATWVDHRGDNRGLPGNPAPSTLCRWSG